MRLRSCVSIVLLAALVASCQAVSTPVAAKGGKAGARPKAVDALAKRGRLPLAEPRRIVDPTDLIGKTKFSVVELVGKAKLISDKGLGIISNNAGALISDSGGGLISNNGGGLISDKGLGRSGAGYSVLQAGARPESLLAEAEIEVLDAAGNLLVGQDGKPLGGVTGRDGAYKLTASLPDENLILRVRLYQGGQLFAVLPRDRRIGEVNLDTASSLGTRYVLDQFVKGDQKVFDRLPGHEAAALQGEVEAARGLLGTQAPAYDPAELVAAAEVLRGKDPAVGQRIETIKALLLAGQENLGTGLPATRVALSLPTGVVGDPAGNLYIAEVAAFRVRKVNQAGLISVLAGIGARDAQGGMQGQTLEAVTGVAWGPDGALYLTQTLTNQIRKVAPDGTMTAVLDALSGTTGGLKFPGGLAVSPDGTIYVGEIPNTGDHKGRVVAVHNGVLTDVSPPGATGDEGDTAWPGVALGADGTLYACEYKSGGQVYRRKPNAAWERFADVPGLNSLSRLWAEPGGSLLVSAARNHQVVRIAPDGVVTTVAGTGEQGADGDGGPATAAKLGSPAGLWRSPAGDIYIADGDGLVRRIAADGTISTFAGTTGLIEGDALGLSVNGPNGLALAPDGKLVFSETAGSTIKRLDGRAVSVLAGAGTGYEGDGGPATRAKFSNPAGIAYGPDGTLWVLDTLNRAVRRVDPAGIVTTAVRDGGDETEQGPGPYPPGLAPILQPVGCTVGPNGLFYWADAKGHQVLRLNADGRVEAVVGMMDEAGDPDEDKPARECSIRNPLSVAFDPKGDLFVLAAGNSRVFRVAGGSPTSRVETVVGLTPQKFLGAFLGGAKDPAADEGAAATDVMLLGASAMCFDPAGNLYVAELGTNKLASFGGASLGGTEISAELIAALPQVSTRIRRIGLDGTIRTVAGHGTQVVNDPAGDNILMYPLNMIVDREGRLIIADSALNQIKLIPKGSF